MNQKRFIPTLHGRIVVVLTALLAVVLVILAMWWAREARNAIHEEVQAATRVAEQWLVVLIPETLRDTAQGQDRLMTHLQAVGRLRANRLEVLGPGGDLLHVSPEPTWKAGRDAPHWFARWISPVVPERRFAAGEWEIVLRPDTSRAVLDAWDDVTAGLGWAGAVLLLVWVASRAALNRALAPLGQIEAALSRGADGKFDTRLPAFHVQELDHLAESYNRLADSLDRTRAHNVRLEQDQAFSRAVQSRLEEERRLIARELHDEVGQAVTAVRAITGAILQRTADQPQLYGSAQAIMAMTGQMQDGVRTIVQRLRPPAGSGSRLDQAVSGYCALWSSHHPDIQVECRTTPLPSPAADALALAVLRLLQESLTNVARHACASRVEVRLECDDEHIELEVTDNGRGLAGTAAPNRFGITGMRERVSELHGELRLESPREGGLRVRALLPRNLPLEESHDGDAA